MPQMNPLVGWCEACLYYGSHWTYQGTVPRVMDGTQRACLWRCPCCQSIGASLSPFTPPKSKLTRHQPYYERRGGAFISGIGEQPMR